MNSLWSPSRIRSSGILEAGATRFDARALVDLAGGGQGMLSRTALGAPRVRVIIGGVRNDPPIGDAVWSLESISAQPRTIVDLDGHPLGLPGGGTLGSGSTGELAHWLSPELASACCADARAALARAVGRRDPAPLGLVLRRIMDCYNALNVPWQIDPPARMLWRRWLSGPPRTVASAFDAHGDFNPCTTTRAQLDPRVYVCNAPQGRIPIAGRDVFVRCLPAGPTTAQTVVGQFVSYYWCGQDLCPGTTLAGSTLPVPLGPGDNRNVWPSRAIDRVVGGGMHLQNYAGVGGSPAGFGEVRDSACNPSGRPDPINGWDAYGFDSGWVGLPPPLRYAAASKDFVPWLDAWISALERRTPEQVVIDARLFALYLNGYTVAGSGYSDINAAAHNMGVDLSMEWAANEQATQDLGIVRGAGSALGGVVAAFAVAAGASSVASAGIGALIVGSVAAITAIAAALWPPDLSAVYLDDLLRPRPWIERSWLDGTPADQTPAGAPVNVYIVAPAGFVSGASTAIGPHTAHTAAGSSSSSGSSGGALLVGGALLAGTAAVGQGMGWWNLASLLPRGK
jgi:hypothetical protein